MISKPTSLCLLVGGSPTIIDFFFPTILTVHYSWSDGRLVPVVALYDEQAGRNAFFFPASHRSLYVDFVPSWNFSGRIVKHFF